MEADTKVEQHRLLLERVLASIANVDSVYTAWNACTPGWDGGPVFEPESQTSYPTDSHAARWRVALNGTTYRVSDDAFQRFYMPIRHEINADSLRPHPRPLAGLSAFRHAVEAEVRFLCQDRATPGRTTNAGYMEAFWGEVLWHLLARGPVLALNSSMQYVMSPSAHRRALSDDPRGASRIGSGAVRVNIVAQVGHLWVRLIPTRPSALLSEFREADSLVSLNECPDFDDAVDCSIMHAARELAYAARTSLAPPSVLEVVCTRLEAPKTLPHMIPPVSSPGYWTAPEEHRFEWRLAMIAMAVEQTGIRMRFGTVQVPIFQLPPPPPPTTLPPTSTLNLDVSALLGLASDVSHSGGMLDVFDTTNRPLSGQIEAEKGTGLFDILAAAFSGTNTGCISLATTPECAAKFRDIVETVGSATELERARAMFPQAKFHKEDICNKFWESSDISESTVLAKRLLALPVCIVNQQLLADTYASDQGAMTFSSSLSSALESLIASRSTHPKALSNSLHTWQALYAGVKYGITTVTAHAHGLRDLLTAHRFQMRGTMPHNAVIWLIRPRSLAGRAARPPPDALGISPQIPQESFKPYQPAALEISRRSTLDMSQFESPSLSPVPRFDWEHRYEAEDSYFDVDSVDRKSCDISGASLSHSEQELVKPRVHKRRSWIRAPPTPLRRQSDPDSNDGLSEATRLNIETPLETHAPYGKSKFLAALEWLAGPRIPARLEIRHYPWWPFGGVEEAYMKLTDKFSWKDARGGTQPAGIYRSRYPLFGAHQSNDSLSVPWRAWLRNSLHDYEHNRIHWLTLCAALVLWFALFVWFVHHSWFSGMVLGPNGWHEPEPLDCTDTFWLRNAQCGLHGAACGPFDGPEFTFRCPSKCMNTMLLNPRTVGNVQYNYMPLVVGGPSGSGDNVYRADSFICAAAQHAGVTTDNGGCGVLRRTGMFSGFRAKERNDISSIPFEGVFPASFTMSAVRDSVRCTDDRSVGYVLNVVMSAFVTFVLRPRPAVLFWILAVVGFWHVNFVSEIRDSPVPVGKAVGDFLPYLFVCYCIWRVAGRFLWCRFQHVPLEFGIFTLGLWWIGVLMTIVFEDVPLQRLVLRDIVQQPGGVTSLIVVLIVAVILTAKQVLVIRATGYLPKYLFFYLLGLGIVLLGLAVPREGVRIHHYIVGLAFIPACAFPTRISLILFAFLFGMYINGVARWGFDGILEDLSVIQGDATGSTLLPEFDVDRSTWLSSPSRIVNWKPIPQSARNMWDSYMLLVDDVLRYHGTGTSFDLAELQDIVSSTSTFHPGLISASTINNTIQNSAHYLRLAFVKNGAPGDFTMSATAFFNGTWKNPPMGRT